MSAITTHVLDLASGKPAAGVRVSLEIREASQGWKLLATGATDANGRANGLLPKDAPLIPGTYRLLFQLSPYFAALKIACFFPEASVVFTVLNPAERFHVPLLLSPHGYTTYRGS